MAFATIALAQLVFVFSIRSVRAPAWHGPRNDALVASVLASAVLLGLVIYAPAFREPFGTEALGPAELGVVLAFALIPTHSSRPSRRSAAGHDLGAERAFRGSQLRGKPQQESGRAPMARAPLGSMLGVSSHRKENTVGEAKQAFCAKPGDWIVVHGKRVGEPGRTGLILEVLGEPDHEHYRVRWDEEHESIFYPGSDATISSDPLVPREVAVRRWRRRPRRFGRSSLRRGGFASYRFSCAQRARRRVRESRKYVRPTHGQSSTTSKADCRTHRDVPVGADLLPPPRYAVEAELGPGPRVAMGELAALAYTFWLHSR
jgi:Domain of unknown function (DUF1918)/Cation transporting ATPase, C-terminus